MADRPGNGYQQLHLTVPAEKVEELAARLERQGAVAISLSGEGAILEPSPGQTPLWPRVKLTALFPAERDLKPLRVALEREVGTFEETFLPERSWTSAWREQFRPLRFGRLYIAPPSDPPREPGLIHLKLEPGLAFGTGTHPTTALCLEALSALDLKGKRVVDYGCGSGILAIAALLLGAREAHAVDIDPQALEAAAANARKNRVELALYLAPKQVPCLQADLVVANILASSLIELAPRLTGLTRPGGLLLLSGLLADQLREVVAAYRQSFDFEPPRLREEWVLLRGRKSDRSAPPPGGLLG